MLVRHFPIVAAGLFTVGAFTLFAFALYWRSSDQQRIEEIARQNQMALCSFKYDLEQRLANLESYILEVNAGRRPLTSGTTLNELLRILKNQRATLGSLTALECE